ncbi:Bifunctional dihydrofolate reductase/thymidylate synthase [uncultured virus]|nr:Bifunctional dihydrofolate reductase/thymidylate synthase [uncultured virus]
MNQRSTMKSEKSLLSEKLSRFNIIVAIDGKYGIGKNGSIPWKNAKDMANFRKLTMESRIEDERSNYEIELSSIQSGFEKSNFFDSAVNPAKQDLVAGNCQNVVIMGRKTWESLPSSSRPLRNRKNIVISSRVIDEVTTVASLRSALQMSKPGGEVFIIGGQQLYEEAIRKYPYLCDRIYVSHVSGSYDCDVFFPYDEVLQLNHNKITEVFDDLTIETFTISEVHQEYQYLNLLAKILKEGDTRGDRTGVGTKSMFGQRMEFDLRKGFPLLTTKRTWFQGIKKELLFFISGKTDSKILESQGVNIWKDNTTSDFLSKRGLKWREGDMGQLYGHQWRHAGATYVGCDTDYSGQGTDQLAEVINSIRTDPFGRRHIISAWDAAHIKDMVLPPCHCMVQFYVGTDEACNPAYLDCTLYQRSADMFLGVPFNIASYALLMSLIGHITGLIPRRFIHNLGDAHIYLSHIDQVTEQLSRTPLPLPTISFSEVKSTIDDFELNDIILDHYQSWDPIKAQMAV